MQHIIIPDADQQGLPIITNGLALTKIHHSAYNQHLIGIDGDYKVHLANSLINLKDEPTLAILKIFYGKTIRLPKAKRERPDPERLQERF